MVSPYDIDDNSIYRFATKPVPFEVPRTYNAGFDPNQPRDDVGMWSETGAGAAGKVSDGSRGQGRTRSPEQLQSMHHAMIKARGPLENDLIRDIQDYTRESDEINLPLRRGRNTYSPLQAAALKELPEEQIVYRGISKRRYSEWFEGAEHGRVIQSKGFSSTTLNPRYATKFSPGTDKVVMEIKAKRGIYISDHAEQFGEPEYELLQAHDTKYRYVGETRDATIPGTDYRTTIVHLEEI